MDHLGKLYVLTVLLLAIKTVLGTTNCTHTLGGITVALTCEHGCCDLECCSEPFDWTEWYFITGIALAGVFLLVCIVGLIVYTCVHCCCKSQPAPRRPPEFENRVTPAVTIIYANNNSTGRHPQNDRSTAAADTSVLYTADPPSYQESEFPTHHPGPSLPNERPGPSLPNERSGPGLPQNSGLPHKAPW